MSEIATIDRIRQEYEGFVSDYENRVTNYSLDRYQTGALPTDYGRYLSAANRLKSAVDAARRKSGAKRAMFMLQAARLFAHCRYLKARLPDLGDPEVLAELDAELCEARLERQIAIDVLHRKFRGVLDKPTIDTLLQSSIAMRRRIADASPEDLEAIAEKYLLQEDTEPLASLPSVEVREELVEAVGEVAPRLPWYKRMLS